MKKILTLAGKLFGIAAVSALILGLTNQNTQPVIEQRQADLFKQSYTVAYPTGKDFEIVEENINPNINQVIKVSDGGNVIGYIFNSVGYGGYGGPINFIVGISNEGIIQGFKAITHSETKGYGSKIEEDDFINGVKDVNISKGVKYGSGNKETGEIQAISGATRSTNAVVNGLYAAVQKMSDLSDLIVPLGEIVEPYHASSYAEIYPDANKFKEVKDDIYSGALVRIIEAYKDDEKLGLMIQLKGNGFGGPINMLIGIDQDKIIHKFKFVSHNETKNYGAFIDDEIYMKNLIGKSLASGIKLKKNPTRTKDILVISGATVTSNAMKDSLNSAVSGLKAYEKLSEPKLEEMDLKAILEAENVSPTYDYLKFFADIDKVEEIENSPKNDSVIRISKAFKSDKEVGKIIDVNTKGFAGKIELGILVDSKGVIQQFKIYNHSESEGYGDHIQTEVYQKTILGKNLSKIDSFTAVAKPSKENEVEAISGATSSTNSMLNGLNAALEAYKSLK